MARRNASGDASIVSTGLSSAASGGRNAASWRAGRRRERRHDEAVGLAGVGGEDPGPAAVGQDGDPAGRRGSGWFASSDGHVEELAERVGPDHAGLVEQRVDRDVRGADERPRVRDVARAPAAERPLLTAMIGLVRPTRRAIRENLRGLPTDSRYSAMTLRRRVVLPVLEEVVAREVGLVADRDEGRQPEAEAVGVLDDREAERAALREEPDAPVDRQGRGERGVEPDVGLEVDDAHAVGPDEAHARAAARRDELALAGGALRPRSRRSPATRRRRS